MCIFAKRTERERPSDSLVNPEITGEINQLLVEIIENDDSDEEFDGEDEEEDSFADNSEDLSIIDEYEEDNLVELDDFELGEEPEEEENTLHLRPILSDQSLSEGPDSEEIPYWEVVEMDEEEQEEEVVPQEEVEVNTQEEMNSITMNELIEVQQEFEIPESINDDSLDEFNTTRFDNFDFDEDVDLNTTQTDIYDVVPWHNIEKAPRLVKMHSDETEEQKQKREENKKILEEFKKFNRYYPDIDESLIVPAEVLNRQGFSDVPVEVQELCRTTGFITASKFMEIALKSQSQLIPSMSEQILTDEMIVNIEREHDILHRQPELLIEELDCSGFGNDCSGNDESLVESLSELSQKLIAKEELDTSLNMLSQKLDNSQDILDEYVNNAKIVSEKVKSDRVASAAKKSSKQLVKAIFNRESQFDTQQFENEISIENQMQPPKAYNGFSFASGKAIKVNQDIAKRYEKIFNEDNCEDKDEDVIMDEQQPEPAFGGFKYASGKTIKVNQDIVKRYENKFKDTEGNNQMDQQEGNPNSEEDEVPIQNAYLGFKFASGKPIHVSDDKVQMYQKHFMDADLMMDEALSLKRPMPQEAESSRQNLNLTSLRRNANKRVKLDSSLTDSSFDFEQQQQQEAKMTFAPPHASSPMVSQVGVSRRRSFPAQPSNSFNFVPSPIPPPRKVLNIRDDKENAREFEEFMSSSPLRTNREFIKRRIDGTLSQRIDEFDSFIIEPSQQLLESEKNQLLEDVEWREKLHYQRDEALRQQIAEISKKCSTECRQMQGTLFMKKSTPNRESLWQFLNNEKPKHKNLHRIPKSSILSMKFDCCDYEKEIFVTLGDNAKVILDYDSKIGFKQIKWGFLSSLGVDPKLASEKWIENAYQMIVQKLIWLENCFDKFKKFELLNAENILLQLKYRYDREIDLSHRPALRKITELDEVPQRRMVLRINDIYMNGENNLELELTDGWYKIPAIIDKCIVNHVDSGKLKQETKLIISGAGLVNCHSGHHPLDLPTGAKLQIFGNSTRVANNDVKLGFYHIPTILPINLNSIHSEGGVIGRLKLYITHVYSIVYIETVGEKKDYRSEKMQMRVNNKNELLYSRIYDDIYEKVLKDFHDDLTTRIAELKKMPFNTLTNEDISDLIEYEQNSCYGSQLWDRLGRPQRKFVLARREELKIIFRTEAMDKMTMIDRNKTVSLLKFRVVDAKVPDKTALVSWYYPNEDVLDSIKQGLLLEIFNAMASTPYDEIRIRASKNTSWNVGKFKADDQKYQKFIRTETKFEDIKVNEFKPPQQEFDVACMVVRVDDKDLKTCTQDLFVTDDKMNLMCIRFMPNISEYAYENTLKEGGMFYICNLQWRNMCHAKESTIPIAHAVPDTTTFIINPKKSDQQARLNSFCESIGDVMEFYRNCREKLDGKIESNRVTLKLGLEDNPELARIFTNRQYGKKCPPRRFHF